MATAVAALAGTFGPLLLSLVPQAIDIIKSVKPVTTIDTLLKKNPQIGQKFPKQARAVAKFLIDLGKSAGFGAEMPVKFEKDAKRILMKEGFIKPGSGASSTKLIAGGASRRRRRIRGAGNGLESVGEDDALVGTGSRGRLIRLS